VELLADRSHTRDPRTCRTRTHWDSRRLGRKKGCNKAYRRNDNGIYFCLGARASIVVMVLKETQRNDWPLPHTWKKFER
jgi:hypothetical protein